MADARVRVWHEESRDRQHFADPPEDETTVQWDGRTDCGREGRLRWIHHEQVDAGSLCPECLAVSGPRPPLLGDHPGPP